MAVWHKIAPPVFMLKTNLLNASLDFYSTYYAIAQGYQLQYLSAYSINGLDYYAALWSKPANASPNSERTQGRPPKLAWLPRAVQTVPAGKPGCPARSPPADYYAACRCCRLHLYQQRVCSQPASAPQQPGGQGLQAHGCLWSSGQGGQRRHQPLCWWASLCSLHNT